MSDSDADDYEQMQKKQDARATVAPNQETTSSEHLTVAQKTERIKEHLFPDRQSWMFAKFLFRVQVFVNPIEANRAALAALELKKSQFFVASSQKQPLPEAEVKWKVLGCHVDFYNQVLDDLKNVAKAVEADPQIKGLFIVEVKDKAKPDVSVECNLWNHTEFRQHLVCLLCDATHEARKAKYTEQSTNQKGAIYMMSGQANKETAWPKFAAADFIVRMQDMFENHGLYTSGGKPNAQGFQVELAKALSRVVKEGSLLDDLGDRSKQASAIAGMTRLIRKWWNRVIESDILRRLAAAAAAAAMPEHKKYHVRLYNYNATFLRDRDDKVSSRTSNGNWMRIVDDNKTFGMKDATPITKSNDNNPLNTGNLFAAFFSCWYFAYCDYCDAYSPTWPGAIESQGEQCELCKLCQHTLLDFSSNGPHKVYVLDAFDIPARRYFESKNIAVPPLKLAYMCPDTPGYFVAMPDTNGRIVTTSKDRTARPQPQREYHQNCLACGDHLWYNCNITITSIIVRDLDAWKHLIHKGDTTITDQQAFENFYMSRMSTRNDIVEHSNALFAAEQAQRQQEQADAAANAQANLAAPADGQQLVNANIQ